MEYIREKIFLLGDLCDSQKKIDPITINKLLGGFMSADAVTSVGDRLTIYVRETEQSASRSDAFAALVARTVYERKLEKYLKMRLLGALRKNYIAKNWLQTLVIADKILTLDPKSVSALSVKGEILRTGSESKIQRNAQLSQECFEKALAIVKDDASPELLRNFGELLRTQAANCPQNAARAHKLITKALEKNPNYAPAWTSLGELLLVGGVGVAKDIKKARNCFNRAVQIDPKNILALQRIATQEV